MNSLKKTLFMIIASVISLMLLYYNIIYTENRSVGIILFLFFLLLTAYPWSFFYKKVFGVKRNSLVNNLYSVFTVFFLLSIFSAISVWAYRLTEVGVWGVFCLTGGISWIIGLWVEKSKIINLKSKMDIDININTVEKALLKPRLFLIVGYVLLWIITLALFIRSGNDQSILQTPWQTLNPYILPSMFGLMFLLGIILLSKFKIRGILFLLIAQTFLMHLYLPISHELPWGGDVWRHLAIEDRVLDGESILPVLIGHEAVWNEVWGVDIPEVFLHPQKYSYGQLWGTTILLSRTLHIDLISLNKWLLPILWSLVFPILLYQLGVILLRSKRGALWLVWLSLIPFSLQAVGSLTLPVSLGLLGFLYTLTLWFQYLRTKNTLQKRWAIVFSLLLIFGYSLYFFLMWFAIGMTWAVRLREGMVKKSHLRTRKILVILILVLISISFIPIIELFAKTSHWPGHWSLFESVKQLVGQFTGWYYASGIRPHDIMSGNIFFNHTPEWSFVASAFTVWRWYVIPLTIMLWVVVKYGLWRAMFREKDLLITVCGLLTIVVVSGYVIGWFILEGDRLLIRRLDPLMVVLLLVFLVYGMLTHVTHNTYHVSKRLMLVVSLSVVIVLSFFATANYASGPDMRVVSVDEYRVAEYVWNNSNQLAEQQCVLADTWTLLALEAVSGRKIIGGGFPIDYQFGQPERERLLRESKIKTKIEMVEWMGELTGAKSCFVISDGDGFGNTLFDEEIGRFGTLLVWRIEL